MVDRCIVGGMKRAACSLPEAVHFSIATPECSRDDQTLATAEESPSSAASMGGSRHPKKARTQGKNTVSNMKSHINELQAKLDREIALRRLLEEEALQANTACAAYHELSVSFCAAFVAAEREFERTAAVLRRNISDWESWGAGARVLLEQHGLLATAAEEAAADGGVGGEVGGAGMHHYEDAADSCSVISADECCNSQC